MHPVKQNPGQSFPYDSEVSEKSTAFIDGRLPISDDTLTIILNMVPIGDREQTYLASQRWRKISSKVGMISKKTFEFAHDFFINNKTLQNQIHSRVDLIALIILNPTPSKGYGVNLLDSAVKDMNVIVVKDLLSLGLDPNKVNLDGCRPLEYLPTCVSGNSMDMIKFTENACEIIKLLAKAKVNFHAEKNYYAYKLLSLVSCKGNITKHTHKVFECALGNGLDINYQDEENGNNILHVLLENIISCDCLEEPNTIQYFLDKGASPTMRNFLNNTPLDQIQGQDKFRKTIKVLQKHQ